MKSWFHLWLGSSLLLMVWAAPAVWGVEMTEPELIGILQSNGSPKEKDAACAQLKRVGTARSIPALAALLTDDQLSHSACYVLESMPAPEAGEALLRAVGQTSGLTRAGLLNSLGFRHETRAVPVLLPLLGEGEVEVQEAAARALGQIGGPAALAGLEAAAAKSTGPAHAAEVDGILRYAQQLLATGQGGRAVPIFRRVYQQEPNERVKHAAFRGLLLAGGRRSRALVLEALNGPAGPSQTAAVQVIHELNDPGLGKAVTKVLPKLPPVLAVAVLEGLSQRVDVPISGTITDLARTGPLEVRVSALKLIGLQGDAGAVPLLAEAAARAVDAEQAAARQGLIDLRRGNVAQALMAELASAKPAVQAELARALGARSETAAIPNLMALARQGDDSARRAVFRALAVLADQPQLADLVALVAGAPDSSARAQAVDAVNNALQTIRSRHGRVDPSPIVSALEPGRSVETRAALLSLCSGLAETRIRAALQRCLDDTEPQVRAAAVQALADTTDPELLAELLKRICDGREVSARTPLVSGCVRLLTQEEAAKFTLERKLEAFEALLAAGLSPEQKRKVLAGAGELGDPRALALVEPQLTEPGVQAEAASAAIKLVPGLADTERAESLLRRIGAQAGDTAIRQTAEAALKPILARADYILAWQAAGPYREADKDYAALFEIAFAPETPGSPGVSWRPLVPGLDPNRPILMDLLKTFGGEQCVAYARTWVYSEQAQPARLEVGADDGVKVWFNGEQVCAKNVPRAIQPGSEQANVALKAGWNSLLLKVTQLNQGWEFCARLVKPDGSRLAGLRFDPAHQP